MFAASAVDIISSFYACAHMKREALNHVLKYMCKVYGKQNNIETERRMVLMTSSFSNMGGLTKLLTNNRYYTEALFLFLSVP